MRTVTRWAWLAGLIIIVLDFAVLLIPAMFDRYGEPTPLAITLLVLGVALIALSVIVGLVRLNTLTGGAVGEFARVAGTAYVGYKVVVGVARHIDRDIHER